MQANFRNIIASRDISSYPDKKIKLFKLMSLDKNGNAKPFGSDTYRIQKYPGDIDLIEIFSECCSIEDVVEKAAKAIQRIVKKIKDTQSIYYFELKLGLDKRFDVNIGYLIDGSFFINRNLIHKKSELLHNLGLLSDEEIALIADIIYKQDEDLTDYDYDVLYKIFKDKREIFWKEKEILKGYKSLPGDKKITLQEALQNKNKIRLGIISKVNDRFIEVSNFIVLVYEDMVGRHYNVNLNVDLANYEEIDASLNRELRVDIEKFFFSDYYYNPFKGIKRMFALARHNKDKQMIELLTPIISSNISELYQIATDVDTIIKLIDLKKFPKEGIKNELQNMKDRISKIYQISNQLDNTINKKIDKITSGDNFKQITMLEDLKLLLKQLVNEGVEEFISTIPSAFPPRNYLPQYLQYEKAFDAYSDISVADLRESLKK